MSGIEPNLTPNLSETPAPQPEKAPETPARAKRSVTKKTEMLPETQLSQLSSVSSLFGTNAAPQTLMPENTDSESSAAWTQLNLKGRGRLYFAAAAVVILGAAAYWTADHRASLERGERPTLPETRADNATFDNIEAAAEPDEPAAPMVRMPVSPDLYASIGTAPETPDEAKAAKAAKGPMILDAAKAEAAASEASKSDTAKTAAVKVEPAQHDKAKTSVAELKLPEPTVFFAYKKAHLSAGTKAALDTWVLRLKKNKKMTLTLAGHCDERGTKAYNLKLGRQRAAAAKAYLVKRGVEPRRIYTVSYGKSRPVVSGHGESAWAQNRRVELKTMATTVAKR